MVAARIDIKHLVTESRSVPRTYFKGLNFLLNEQPDKAIEGVHRGREVDRRRSTCTSRWQPLPPGAGN
jgi:lipopolysaccharide biosynthesis regulator YciM